MKSEKQIRNRIEQLETKIPKLERIVNVPMQTPGAYVAGPSNYKLGKKLDAENDRKAEAFRKLQKAKSDLAHYTTLLRDYEAGERHLNGQRRADAPSKQRWKNAKEKLAAFMRERVNKGDKVAIQANPNNRLTVKRVNKKSITSESDVIWNYEEIMLLDGEEPMQPEKFLSQLRAWLKEQGE